MSRIGKHIFVTTLLAAIFLGLEPNSEAAAQDKTGLNPPQAQLQEPPPSQKTQPVLARTLAETSPPSTSSKQEIKDLIDAFDRRLSDIWGIISLLGYVSALLGCLITGIVVFFSIKSTNTAIAEARAETRKFIDDWLKTNAAAILATETKLALGPQLDQALKEIKDAATPILVALDEELQKTTKLTETFEVTITNGRKTIEAEAALTELSSTEQSSAMSDTVVSTVASAASSTYFQLSKSKKLPPFEHPFKEDFDEGNRLVFDEHNAEAIAKFESIIEQLGDSKEENDLIMIGKAKLGLCEVFESLDQPRKVLELCDSVITENLNTAQPRLKDVVVRAYYHKASTEQTNGRYEAAIQIVNDGLELLKKPPQVSRAVPALRLLNVKGNCLISLQRYKEALENDAEIDAIASQGVLYPVEAVYIRNGRHRTAQALVKLGRIQEAKVLLRTFIESDSAPHKSGGGVSRIQDRLLLANICEDEGKYDEALAIYSFIIESSQQSENEKLLPARFVVQALLRKAAILSKLSLTAEELRVYDEIVQRCKSTSNSGNSNTFKEYAVTALVNKAIAFSKMARADDAITIINDVLGKYRESTDKAIVEQVAKAAKLKALLER